MQAAETANVSLRPVDWQVENIRNEGIVYMKPLTHERVTMKCSSLGCLAANSIDVGFDLFLGAAPYKVCTCLHTEQTHLSHRLQQVCGCAFRDRRCDKRKRPTACKRGQDASFGQRASQHYNRTSQGVYKHFWRKGGGL